MKSWILVVENSCPSLDPAIPNSHSRLPLCRDSNNRCSYSLDSSRRPPTGGGCIGAILLVYHHLNCRPISLFFRNLNSIDCTHWIPIGYRIPDGYGHGYRFIPMGIVVGGYRKFLWVWVWAEGGCTRPYPTHYHPYNPSIVTFLRYIVEFPYFLNTSLNF